jgi:hypothetical protein
MKRKREMNAFVNGATSVKASKKDARTANGAVTRSTSGQAHVDLFAVIGSARNAQNDVVKLFDKAYAADKATALRVALWARNVRGGAGERDAFRNIVRRLSDIDSKVAAKLIPFMPVFGRWDDAIESLPLVSPLFAQAADNLKLAIDNGDGLAAKWTPRKGAVAVALRQHWGMAPKQYRKYLVNNTKVVETLMCNKEWEAIEFDKLPSLASMRYQTAFKRNAPNAYTRFEKKLVSGEVTVNAGTLFPHDLVANVQRGSGSAVVLDAQWKALPDYLAGRVGKALVLSDTSSSMSRTIGGTSASALQVSIALGLYISERQVGPFKDLVLTFADNSDFHKVVGSTLQERVRSLAGSRWGGTTNFQSSFKEILRVAKANNVPAADMPELLIVLSDMEFNAADGRTNFGAAKKQFADAGYKMPTIVFWNLNARAGNNPVKFDTDGTAMVSGYSPAILEAILGGKFDITIPDAPAITPFDVMNAAIFNEVYDVVDQIV